jgi:hypothetical protein
MTSIPQTVGGAVSQAAAPVVAAISKRLRVDYTDRLTEITRRINQLDEAINEIIGGKIETQKNVANNRVTQQQLQNALDNLMSFKTQIGFRKRELEKIRIVLSTIKDEAKQKFKTETSSFNDLERKIEDLNKEISQLVITQDNFIKTKFPERLEGLKVSLEGFNLAFNQIESDKTRYIRQQEEWEKIIRNIAARPQLRPKPIKPNKQTLYDFKIDINATLERTKRNFSEINTIKREIEQFVISTGRQLTYLNDLSLSNIDKFTRVKADLEGVLAKQKTIISSLCPDATPAQETEMEELRNRLNALKQSITTRNLSLTKKDKDLNSNTLTAADITRIQRELTAPSLDLVSMRSDLTTASGTIERLKYDLNRELSSLDSLITEVNNSYRETVDMLRQIERKASQYRPYVPPAPPPPPPVWANRIPLDLNTTPRTSQDWTLPVDPRSGWITGDIQPADYHNKRNFRSNTDRNINQKCFPNAYYPAPFDKAAICKPLDWNRRYPQNFYNTDRTSLYDICEWINQTDNEVVVFHGTHLKKIREFFGGRQTNDNLNTIATNHSHLLGQGFYVTFNPNEALGYVKDTPPSSIHIPIGTYVPAIYEIVLRQANEYKRGGHDSRDPSSGLINSLGEVFHFIQNNHRTTAKEQIAFIHQANVPFRATINKDKIHVHTYANGTTVSGGNHDQNNNSWGPCYGNQNIPYLRVPGYRNKHTYPS